MDNTNEPHLKYILRMRSQYFRLLVQLAPTTFSRSSMWKFVVLTWFTVAVVCTAQHPNPPQQPQITETFYASGYAEIHRGVTLMGNARLVRNAMLEVGLEEYIWDNNGTNETTENLERYDMGEEFKIRSNKSVLHCQTEKTNGKKLPHFWGWLKTAHYAGNITVRFINYSHWVNHVGGGVRLEVGVGLQEVNRPYYFVRQTAESFLAVGIEMFVLEPPTKDLFEVPKECIRAKTNTRGQQRQKATRRMRVNTNIL